MRYWIGVASQQHVQRGVEGGFAQLCHGQARPLQRMAEGDWIVYYSPREGLPGSTPCQAFTAIGEVGGLFDSVELTTDFLPYRRQVRFLPAQDVPIRPLLPLLSFITDKQRWGHAFRLGYVEIPQDDFELIATAMLGQQPGACSLVPPAIFSV